MSWLKIAHKQFLALSSGEQAKILAKVNCLTSTDGNLDIKKLKGYKDLFRLRCGEHRVVFSVDKNVKHLSIAVIGHRKNVYDFLKAFGVLFFAS